MTLEGLPLRAGASGEAVRDLHRRLKAAGLDVRDDSGIFGAWTETAVKQFQASRGLVADGVCGVDTWISLVDAGYRLGDRLLYLRSPMLRGEDVAELQRQLGALGFDSGRVDGIFGPCSERALRDFQRNAGLTTDGVSGPEVRAALGRLGQMTDGPVQVASIRERELLNRLPRQLADRRIVIGDLGGLSVPAVSLAQALRDEGAIVTVIDHPDRSEQAAQANNFGAELYLGLCPSSDGVPRAAYYSTAGFESVGGRRLAELAAEELRPLPFASGHDLAAAGMRLAVLRETRMPAVVCQLTRIEWVSARHPQLAEALRRAVARWVDHPVDS
jgi:N-acetylmuramoyl-L-alanine amidase